MKNKLVITLLCTALVTAAFTSCGKKQTVYGPTESTEAVMDIEPTTEEYVVKTEGTEKGELVVTKYDGISTKDTVKSKDDVDTKGDTKSDNSSKDSTDSKESDKKDSSKIDTKADNKDPGTKTDTTSSSQTTAKNDSATDNSQTQAPADAPAETPTPEPEPEPETPALQSFPYALNTLYENGDGTGCIYILDNAADTREELDAMESWYSDYEDEQYEKINSVGGTPNSYENLGKYAEGYIKKISYIPNPYVQGN